MLAPEVLSEIRSKLARYRTVACGLVHEQVVELTLNETGQVLKRLGLCSGLARKYQLGCAHSKANQEFCDLVLSIGNHFPGIQVMADQLARLYLDVYTIDHAKGVLEKQLALAKLANESPLVSAAEAAIAEVTVTHHMLIDRIEKLRSQIMAILSCDEPFKDSHACV